MQRSTAWGTRGDLSAALVLLGAVLYAVWPLRSLTPLGGDHPVHLFKAWHFWNELVLSGRLRGFSHYWSFGFPSDELVPPGEEMLVALVHALSFGKLSWFTAYSGALALVIGLAAAAAYRFARQYFGCLAALLAGLFVLWDPGGYARQGGWWWFITVGAWPLWLGVSCILCALSSLEKLLVRGTPRQLLFAASWVFAAFLAHQVSILFLPMLTALLLLDHYWRAGGVPARRWLPPLACALGAALAAFYLLPMLARAEQTCDYGIGGVPPAQTARNLLDLRAFAGMWPAYFVLGAVGGAHALWRRKPGALLLNVGAVLFVLLSTDLPIQFLHLERLAPGIIKVEAERMLLGARLFWLVLAAHAVALPFSGLPRIWERLRRWPRATLRSPDLRRHAFGCALVAALWLPFAVPALSRFKEAHIDRPFEAERNIPHLAELRRFWEFSARERATNSTHYRIAYDAASAVHLVTLGPVYDRTPIYKVGFTPTQIYWTFPMLADPRLYRLLSVKYVVSDHELTGPDFTFERRFGALRVYRFNPYDPAPYSVLGSANAELREFSPERIRVRLAQVAPGSHLKLHVSNSDHWQARLDGKDVRIEPATAFGAEFPFLMQVPIADGELELRYVARAADIAGLCLSVLALPAFFAGIWVVRRRPQWLRLPSLSRPRARLAFALVLLTLMAFSAFAWARYQSRAALVAKDSLFRGLSAGQLRLEGQPCRVERAFSWRCGSHSLGAGVNPGQYGNHICFHATSGSELELEVERELGRFVTGRYDAAGPGSIRLSVNGTDIGEVQAQPRDQGQQFVQFDTRPFIHQRAKLRLRVEGGPLDCFDFRVVE